MVTAESAAVDLPAVARDHGLRYLSSLPALGAAVLEGPEAPEVVARLGADPRLAAASADHRFTVTGEACCGADWAAVAPDFARDVQALERAFGPLRAASRGDDVLVAVLDTGAVGEHPALAGALEPGRSFVPGQPWDEDGFGHGTAMASLVAARPAPGEEGLSGVAPGARVLPIAVADRAGAARLSDVAAGIVYAVDRGAQVVLLSLGTRRPSRLLDDAIAYAEARGAVLVAAAGNRNVHVDLHPAADPRVLSVGSLAPDGASLAFATTLAPTTDLLAPGEGALAALPRGYGSVGGSSAAAARVAGAVALVRALAPDLDPAAVRAVLRGARRPLPAFARSPDVARAFPAGPLDPAAALAELRAPRALPALDDARVLPAAAAPGQRIAAEVRVHNPGVRSTRPAAVTVTLGGQPLAALDVPALAPGEERLLQVAAQAGGPAEVAFVLEDARATCRLGAAELPARDLALTRVVAQADEEGGLVLEAIVEGRGLPEAGRVRLSLAGLDLPDAAFAALGPGERATLAWELPPEAAAELPERIHTAEVALVGRGPDDHPEDDRAALDLLPPRGDGDRLRTQYQQSGEVNVCADAPWRLAPGRTYVPVLLFVPEKGSVDPSLWLRIDRARVEVREAALRAAASTTVFDDVYGGATTAAAGTVVLDEMGQAQRRAGRPDLRLFGHQELDVPGRYAIVRVPRDALNAPAGARAERYLEVTTEWSSRRRFLGLISQTRSGTHRKTLRVQLAAEERPRLPGDGHYLDVHLHTMAEWYQDDAFDVLAPRRNWGGPIPMIMESAYAIGLTDAVDGARDRVITTDHNAFYEPGDDLRRRPPFGPTAAAASNGLDEFARMRELFGVTRGEEVAFHAPQVQFNLIQIPFGAHMLVYRGQHVAGPWHGGSGLARSLGDSSANVELEQVLGHLAANNRAENREAAVFAAHPFGSIHWQDEHFAAAFGLDPAKRDLTVNAEGTGFVMKGLQLWNGKKAHSLPSDQIDFADLNPWVEPAWVRGNPDWDLVLNEGLGRWHGFLADLMDYELPGRPGVRFPRKVFVAAGNDAHGDFNFSEDRLATIVPFKSTFEVHDQAFGGCLTYALAAPGEPALDAYLDGQAVLTDGPLLRFSLDAEDRFDGQRLVWHDAAPAHEDADGRIGGGGTFDGLGTALVRRGSPHVRLGYRYTSTPEFGDVTSIAIYRTSEGDPNPLTAKPSGAALLAGRGSLAPAGADRDLEEPLDAAEEGLIAAPTALHLGAFTGDPATLDADGRRCLTNPVWAVPFEASASVASVATDATGTAVIPPGALTVTFACDMSLEARPYAVEIKALDQAGTSTDRTSGPIDVLVPAPGGGWSDHNGARDAALTLTNQRPIPLNLDRYGGADQVTFVVYFYDAPRDAFGNELNRPAFTFTHPGIGTGGGTGPALPRGTAGTTTPAATVAAGGGGGGGGCSLAPAPSSSGTGALLALLLLGGLVALRRRG